MLVSITFKLFSKLISQDHYSKSSITYSISLKILLELEFYTLEFHKRKPKRLSLLLPLKKNPQTLLLSKKKKSMTTKETTKTQTQTRDQSRNHTKQEINHEPSGKPTNLGGETMSQAAKPTNPSPD